jgi:hypothetical protein
MAHILQLIFKNTITLEECDEQLNLLDTRDVEGKTAIQCALEYVQLVYFAIVLLLFCDYFSIVLRLFCDYFAIILDLFWGLFCVYFVC